MDEFSGGVTSLALGLAPATITLLLALALDRLPYRSALGVRTARTLAGEAHWRWAHSLGARVLLVAAALLALISRQQAFSITLQAMVALWVVAVIVVVMAPERKQPEPTAPTEPTENNVS